jgi:general secretion pathway protein A
MYTQFFRLTQAPFSISPDPRYLFMSERHREALAHLLYGVDSGGGVVVLTGDIGTGKTTICRCFLEQVPANCNVAYIFNPRLSATELLQTVCEEFHIEVAPDDDGEKSAKRYIDALNRFLLDAHAEGRNNVLIIDEAQNLAPRVLEQLRLLTNLETNERKLLQIILIGQPELRTMLSRPELEQLAQRVIAHYHLSALSEPETGSYVQHRLAAAGLSGASPFPPSVIRQIHKLSGGVPRRINLLCDRALLGAYANGTPSVDRKIIDGAARELFAGGKMKPVAAPRPALALALAGALIAAGTLWAAGNSRLPHILQTQWKHAIDAGMQKTLGNAAAPAKAAAPAPTPPVQPAAPDVQPVAAATEAGASSEDEAIRLLARLWGTAMTEDNPCAAAPGHGLRCYWGKGGIAELRRLDRPAALKLRDDAGNTHFALLTRLDDASATLRIGALRKPLTMVALARQFDGVFVTLWRATPGFAPPLKLEDKGVGVDWVAAQLAKLDGAPAPVAGSPFDQKLLQQVRQFQQANGLSTDGIIGSVTAMQINRATGVDEPRLLANLQGAMPATE